MAAPSAQQYDFVTGIDFSAVTSVTKTQLLASINKIAPLSNIGGVIVFSSQSTAVWPGITNNPRFRRYLWVDTYTSPPSLKVYDQSGNDTYAAWVSAHLAAGTVGTTQLADDAVTVDKIAVPAAPNARYIMRVNAAGTAIEFAAPSVVMENDDIPLAAINNLAAADKSILQNVASGPAWTTIATVAADVLAAAVSIALTKLDYATASVGDVIQIPRSGTAIPTWTPLTMAAILGTGASSGQVPVWNGSVWLPTSVALSTSSTSELSSISVDVIADTIGYFSYTHGLAAVPKLVSVIFVCKAGDAGYSINDELDCRSFSWVDNPNGFISNEWAVWSNSGEAGITIPAAYAGAAGLPIEVQHKTNGTRTNITKASWYVKINAYL